nr:hypothetical protein [Tanacetum cinerariifolium]
MMKDSDIGIQEKKAKLFNEWERFTSNEGESIESYYHRFLKLINDLKRNKHFLEKIASNLKFLNNLQPKWSRHVTIVHQTKDLHTADYTQLYDFLKYNQKENPRVQNVGNQNGLIGVQGNGNQNHIGNGNLVVVRAEGTAARQNGNQIRCYNCRGVGHYARNCTVRPRRRNAAYLQTQLLIAQKEEVGIQLQAEVYDLMDAAADLDEIEEKMALGYQNPFYLKQAQKKQQSLYDGKVLLEKHDPPVVHDSKETLQLAQKSRDKMKQMNKEIKLANYTKINHLSGVFVPQKALSREELYFSKNSKTANVSKSFLIPNEDLLDDTTPSVVRKFLNEVKSTIVTLERVVKQRMIIETHNWASSAHQELHKIEADDSLVKHKALELEIERLLKAVVSQDIMIIVQNESVVDTSDLQTELERTKERFENCIIKKETEYAKLWNDWYKKYDECKYDKISYDKAYKDMQQKIERLQAQLGNLKGKSKDTSSVSNTRNPLSQKLENKIVELEFQVLNYARENAH